MEKSKIEIFNEKFPNETQTLRNGKSFTYRYYKNPNSKVTFLLLAGGLGISELFFLHFEALSEEYSVLTFDYPMEFKTVNETIDAIAELLNLLGEKVWLVGQSLGGVMSQIFAKHYPELVEGMVLSNTCSLPKDMNKESYKCLMKMMKSERRFKFLLKLLPFKLLRLVIKKALKKLINENQSEDEKATIQCFIEMVDTRLTKSYEIHMVNLLLDCENHITMVPEDFKRWEDKVLLILSEDDKTFNESCKKEIVRIMSKPTVITNLTGGHIALVIKCDKYIQEVCNYVNKRL